MKVREFQQEFVEIYNSKKQALLNPFVRNAPSINESFPQNRTKSPPEQDLLNLSEEQLIKLFFYGNSPYPNFENFLQLIHSSDPNLSTHLIKSLKKIKPRMLFSLFHSTSCSGFIALFKENPSELLALELLKLLDQFAGEDLNILIQDRHTSLFNFLQEQNLLHLICKFQSAKVIEKLFQILRKIEIKELKILLSQRDGFCDFTPVEYAFARQDEPEAGLVVAKLLQENAELRTIFTEISDIQPLSIMHKAAAKGQTTVIAYYLEQEDAQLEHRTASSESMLDLAKQTNQEAVIAYFAALALLQLIKTTEPATNIQELTDYIRANPAILDTLWTEGKTLLHLAVARGLAKLVKLFLQEGASIKVRDAHNLSPIDIALKTNQLDSLKELINADEELSASLAETLNKIENSQLNDCSIYFLKTIGNLLSFLEDQTLLDAVKIYINRSLKKVSATKSKLQYQAWQQQLIVLIFSIASTKRLAILSKLKLSTQEKTQLGLILVHALVQPSIYKELSALEQLNHYQFLKQLSPEANLDLTIAEIHFSNTPLSELPADILLEMANLLSSEALENYCLSRTDPVLIVLTLEKLLRSHPVKTDNLAILFKQLEEEIKPFKNEASLVEHQDFILLLNLISEPELKTFMRTSLAELNKDNPIPQQVQQFFKSFKENSVLRADSLLADLFKDYACSTELLAQTNYQGLSALSAIAKPATINELLENLRPYYLSPQSSAQPQELTNWLQRLENKTQRFSLSPLIMKLDELYDEACELAKPITNAEHYLLYSALKNYAKKLSELAAISFNIHLDQTEKAYNERLKSTLEQLILAFNAVTSQCDKLGSNTYPILADVLNQLKADNTITALCETIEHICVNIDQFYPTKTSETIQP